MEITSIAAAATGLRFIKDSLTALLDAKVDADSRAKIAEALGKLGEAQDAMYSLRDELFRLQTVNGDLQRQIEQQKYWETRLSSYELSRTVGGAVVYRYIAANPEHYACPSCVNKQEIQILQDNRTSSGKFRCTGCQQEFPINARQDGQ